MIHNAINSEVEFINRWVTDPYLGQPASTGNLYALGLYRAPSVYGKRLAKFYSFAGKKEHPHTVWIKIDDDIVFVSRNTIRDLVREKAFNVGGVNGRQGCSMVSANVINHSILSAVHNELGSIH